MIETKVNRSECYGSFSVTADLDGVNSGLYMIHFEDQGLLGCCITSLQPSAGIPRALIARASEEIAIMAKSSGRKLTHKVTLVNEHSQKVLPHLYEEFGYRYQNRDVFNLHLVMVREYNP